MLPWSKSNFETVSLLATDQRDAGHKPRMVQHVKMQRSKGRSQSMERSRAASISAICAWGTYGILVAWEQPTSMCSLSLTGGGSRPFQLGDQTSPRCWRCCFCSFLRLDDDRAHRYLITSQVARSAPEHDARHELTRGDNFFIKIKGGASN
jgi:hypothetical protein